MSSAVTIDYSGALGSIALLSEGYKLLPFKWSLCSLNSLG
jgi:hypothetical protein